MQTEIVLLKTVGEVIKSVLNPYMIENYFFKLLLNGEEAFQAFQGVIESANSISRFAVFSSTHEKVQYCSRIVWLRIET